MGVDLAVELLDADSALEGWVSGVVAELGLGEGVGADQHEDVAVYLRVLVEVGGPRANFPGAWGLKFLGEALCDEVSKRGVRSLAVAAGPNVEVAALAGAGLACDDFLLLASARC